MTVHCPCILYCTEHVCRQVRPATITGCSDSRLPIYHRRPTPCTRHEKGVSHPACHCRDVMWVKCVCVTYKRQTFIVTVSHGDYDTEEVTSVLLCSGNVEIFLAIITRTTDVGNMFGSLKIVESR